MWVESIVCNISVVFWGHSVYACYAVTVNDGVNNEFMYSRVSCCSFIALNTLASSKTYCLQRSPKTIVNCTTDRGDRPAANSRPTDLRQRRPDGRMYVIGIAVQSSNIDWYGVDAVDR